jgi:hypothetical protein
MDWTDGRGRAGLGLAALRRRVVLNGITVSIVAASSPERPEMNAEDRMFAAHKRRDL